MGVWVRGPETPMKRWPCVLSMCHCRHRPPSLPHPVAHVSRPPPPALPPPGPAPLLGLARVCASGPHPPSPGPCAAPSHPLYPIPFHSISSHPISFHPHMHPIRVPSCVSHHPPIPSPTPVEAVAREGDTVSRMAEDSSSEGATTAATDGSPCGGGG
mgnify:CR=1 FL=1